MELKNISIKKNAVFNVILTVANLVFPLITLPYIYRVLNINDIGRIEFSLSFVQYFILVSQLGIPTYGIRQCSKYKNDREKLIKTTQEIILINIFTSLISYLSLIILVNNIEDLQSYKELIIVFGFNIFFMNMGIEWFFQALEDYKYITLRALMVRFISLVLIFLIIKSPADYLFYARLLVLSNGFNAIINLGTAIKRWQIHKITKNYNFKKHFKTIIVLSLISFSITIYTNIDKTMLGIFSGDEAVGLYAVSYKFISVVLSVITSLGIVLLPRLTHYVENELKEKAKGLIMNAFEIVPILAIPACFGVFSLSENIILIMSGEQYRNAALTFQILSPILIINGLANITGISLYSFGKERITLLSTTLGACVNVILNIILIPIMSYNGAAIATVIAELFVLLVQYLSLKKEIKMKFNVRSLLRYIVGGIIIMFICQFINSFNLPLLLSTSLSVMISMIAYFLFLLILREKIVSDVSHKIINSLGRLR